MRILVIRLLGLGDVASILVPAVRYLRQRHPGADVDVLTFGPGVELMALVPEVRDVLAVGKEQWPEDIHAAIAHFLGVAQLVAGRNYDRIVNLDTWFMPCLLARFLRDAGAPVEGNVINLPAAVFLELLRVRALDGRYFLSPGNYLESSYPGMADWTTPWWDRFPDAPAYPEFFLRHACGFTGALSTRLDVGIDSAWRGQAGARRIIALSLSGSRRSKQYRHGAQLRRALEDAGHFVWSGFDGSVPMRATLQRLAATDLLVTVPTSAQWLGRLVGCPSLLIPGPLPPSVLGAQWHVARRRQCQYCYQNECAMQVDFDCLDVPAPEVADEVERILGRMARR